MTNLERHHSEYVSDFFIFHSRKKFSNFLKTNRLVQEETHNGEKVFVYQGNPNEVLLTNVNQTAFLITAYADAKTGMFSVLVLSIVP